jgi:two-component system, NtrC family, response regulator AlgB
MAKVLIVDDEQNTRQHLMQLLGRWGHEAFAAESSRKALELLSDEADFDLTMSDWRIAESDDLALLKTLKDEHPDVVVVLMTTYGTVDNAVATTKDGAYDYLTKPFSENQVQNAVRRGLELRELRSRNQALLNLVIEGPLVESRSPKFSALIETARQLATNDAIILLTGESGAGKNVLARQIHEWSRRRKFPFVTVVCRTLSENPLDTQLFSQVKGSATAAIKDAPAPQGGTVFLDEIAELPLSLQSKFLRFLQDKRPDGGSNRTTRVDTRFIVATNRDLPREIAAGQFRGDLYDLLNVISFRVPALREHMEDLLPLAEKLLADAAVRSRRSGLHFSDEVKRALSAYPWPGNIRELRNVIERAVELSHGNLINREDLPDAIFEPVSWRQSDLRSGPTLRQLEEEHIRRVIAQTPSLEDAADALGIGVATLWRKRKRYHIE